MKRHFTYRDEKSDKFWSIEIVEHTVTIVFGKTNTAGNTNTKQFDIEADAHKEADKLMREKMKKGYKEAVDEQGGKFTENEFWNLIERARKNSEDTDEQVEILSEMLSHRSVGDIIEFAKIFQQLYTSSYQSKLWAAAYIVNGGCSDDGFDYFRGWLIAQGKENYYKTLENPEHLARIVREEDVDDGVECEAMLSAASNAYEIKTGKTYEDFYKLLPDDIFNYPPIDLDWDEDGEQLKRMLPKLYKKFSYNE